MSANTPLTKLLRDAHECLQQAIQQIPTTQLVQQSDWQDRAVTVLEQLEAAAELERARGAGQWIHCCPELLNLGVSCKNTPRRECECPERGSHDHWIAHASPPERQDSAAQTACLHPWTGEGPQPASFMCKCGTKVYRSYGDYVDD